MGSAEVVLVCAMLSAMVVMAIHEIDAFKERKRNSKEQTEG